MAVTPSWWFGLVALVAVLLTVDLLVVGRRDRAPSVREAATWVGGYCLAALAFGGVLLAAFGPVYAGQFVAGWVTEYSLSVDNLFVFLVLMARFAVPAGLQLRVLTIGVVLALVLRAALIAVGAAVVARWSWVFVLFGLFLVRTAWGLLRAGGGVHPGAGPDGEPDAAPNRAVALLTRVVPTTTVWHGSRLLARVDGRRVLTPMLVTMVAIGSTDLLFALDSIPAIFGLTREPYLVVAANAFALMGLRQLYFLVGGLVERLPFLGHGLAAVLAFIGVKLVLEGLHDIPVPFLDGDRPFAALPHISVGTSLAVVVGLLAVTTVAGLVLRRGDSSTVPGQ
ncbi:MAG: TerC/Alx family metal homeostasis membrane protein [Actinobacteria bacterium]|nr:TerC/Alx family metal homeostasis membrane protein [Actinomycetota bacterium]